MAKKERKGMVGLGCDIHEDIAEQFEYTDEKDAMRYYLLERMHAFQRATTPLESSSLPSKANLADGERGALLFIGEKK